MTVYARWTDWLSGLTYASRQRFLSSEANYMMSALRSFDVAISQAGLWNFASFGTESAYGIIANPQKGEHIACGETEYHRAPRSVTVSPAWTSAAWPAAITISAYIPSACDGSRSVAVSTSRSYTTQLDGTVAAGVAFAGITSAGDVVYCSGTGTWVTVGTGAASARLLESSANNGASWTARKTLTASKWAGDGRLATDGTNVLAVPSGTPASDSICAYSTDGGVTWTEYSLGRGVFTPAGVTYDPVRALWLLADASSDDLWSTADPTGTWTKVSDVGTTLIDVVACPDGHWAVAAGYQLLISRDAGATWQNLGIPGSRVGIMDGRLTMNTPGTATYVSGAVLQTGTQ